MSLLAVAEIAYEQPALLWIFKGYPGNKADMTDEAYHTCYAINTTNQAVTPQPCDAKLQGMCVVAKSGCNGHEELYFDGHCYKVGATRNFNSEVYFTSKMVENPVHFSMRFNGDYALRFFSCQWPFF